MKLIKSKKGFTLIEIIVVLVILAILAAAAIPTMLGFINDAKGKALIAQARAAYVAAQMIATEAKAGDPTMLESHLKDEVVKKDTTGAGNMTDKMVKLLGDDIKTGSIEINVEFKASNVAKVTKFVYLDTDADKQVTIDTKDGTTTGTAEVTDNKGTIATPKEK